METFKLAALFFFATIGGLTAASVVTEFFIYKKNKAKFDKHFSSHSDL